MNSDDGIRYPITCDGIATLIPAMTYRVLQRPPTRREGRSAVIRRALRLYLDSRQRASVDEAYARGYGSRKKNEFDELLDGQAWPEK